MTLAGQMAGVLLVIAGLFGAGFAAGHTSRQNEIDTLEQSLRTRESELQAQTIRADGEAATLAAFKDTLNQERARRTAMQRTAEAELSSLTQRVAALTRAAANHENEVRKKANNDEDCSALRALPVCGAVADGLWGDLARPAAAGTH